MAIKSKTGAIGNLTPCPGIRDGYSRSVERHTTRAVWPSCWRCGHALGCKKCGAASVLEVFCWHCQAWGTPLALRHHGVMPDRGPGLDEYPRVFQAAYHAGDAGEDPEMHEALKRQDAFFGPGIQRLRAEAAA